MLGTHRNAAELVDLYVDLVNRFPSIIALIDPFRKEVTGSTLHFITTQRNLVPPAWWLKCCALAGPGCCTSVRVRGGAHGANAEPEHNGLGAGLGAERTSFSRALGGGGTRVSTNDPVTAREPPSHSRAKGSQTQDPGWAHVRDLQPLAAHAGKSQRLQIARFFPLLKLWHPRRVRVPQEATALPHALKLQNLNS